MSLEVGGKAAAVAHLLPQHVEESDQPFGIVTSLDRVLDAAPVGVVFVAAAMAGLDQVGAQVGEYLYRAIAAADQFRDQTADLALLGRLDGMASARVADLMADHTGQRVLVVADGL